MTEQKIIPSLFLYEPGLPCLTVRTLFNNKHLVLLNTLNLNFGTSFPISFLFL